MNVREDPKLKELEQRITETEKKEKITLQKLFPTASYVQICLKEGNKEDRISEFWDYVKEISDLEGIDVYDISCVLHSLQFAASATAQILRSSDQDEDDEYPIEYFMEIPQRILKKLNKVRYNSDKKQKYLTHLQSCSPKGSPHDQFSEVWARAAIA